MQKALAQDVVRPSPQMVQQSHLQPCPGFRFRRSACSTISSQVSEGWSWEAQASSMTLISRTMSWLSFGSAIGRNSTGVCLKCSLAQQGNT